MPVTNYRHGPIQSGAAQFLADDAAGGVVWYAVGVDEIALSEQFFTNHVNAQAEQPVVASALAADRQHVADDAAGGVLWHTVVVGSEVIQSRGGAVTVDPLGTVRTAEPREQKASVLAA